jgi:hypothetical protein
MELSKETFSRIIKATAGGVDWEQFGIEVASLNPDLFIKILDGMEQGWKVEANNMHQSGIDRVDIIKYVRNESGMKLKEAMHWVDSNIIYSEGEQT